MKNAKYLRSVFCAMVLLGMGQQALPMRRQLLLKEKLERAEGQERQKVETLARAVKTEQLLSRAEEEMDRTEKELDRAKKELTRATKEVDLPTLFFGPTQQVLELEKKLSVQKEQLRKKIQQFLQAPLPTKDTEAAKRYEAEKQALQDKKQFLQAQEDAINVEKETFKTQRQAISKCELRRQAKLQPTKVRDRALGVFIQTQVAHKQAIEIYMQAQMAYEHARDAYSQAREELMKTRKAIKALKELYKSLEIRE